MGARPVCRSIQLFQYFFLFSPPSTVLLKHCKHNLNKMILLNHLFEVFF